MVIGDGFSYLWSYYLQLTYCYNTGSVIPIRSSGCVQTFYSLIFWNSTFRFVICLRWIVTWVEVLFTHNNRGSDYQQFYLRILFSTVFKQWIKLFQSFDQVSLVHKILSFESAGGCEQRSSYGQVWFHDQQGDSLASNLKSRHFTCAIVCSRCPRHMQPIWLYSAQLWCRFMWYGNFQYLLYVEKCAVRKLRNFINKYV